ncbi:hypothetical protein ABID59_006280 [Bradyrhizobium sp. S3.3.6]|uniref:DUF5677 domain-containing protein n=1 Tax=Bradyrhizobium sp. S3.3.6 TaxID=3156429 RepID=UPI00339250A2
MARKKGKGGMEVSSLAAHKQKGKLLQPPMNQMGGLQLSSWVNEVLPEMLWAALMLNGLVREECFDKFRTLLDYVANHPAAFEKKLLDLSGLADIDQNTFDEMFKPLCGEEAVKQALAPLMILETLPGRVRWSALIEAPTNKDEAVSTLIDAVALAYDHQSVAATDCRWLRIMTENAKAKLHFAEHLKETFESVVGYPDNEEPKLAAPRVRALEMATRAMANTESASAWSSNFWKECWERWTCVLPVAKELEFIVHKELSDAVQKIYAEVVEHHFQHLGTTGVDARQESAFGLVLYVLHLTLLGVKSSVGQTIQGRLNLRSAVEALIILKFLSKKDDPTIWMQYRNYGTSQAKLAYLKYNEADAPAFVTKELLRDLANTDVWMEFQDIKLGAWADKNLRQMAIDGDTKEFYDKYYDALSAYTHANWSAVSQSTFAICVNPLHRFHKVPVSPEFFAEDAVPDLVKVSNLALDQLNTLYPAFKPRLKLA